jgi:hypothetical protein
MIKTQKWVNDQDEDSWDPIIPDVCSPPGLCYEPASASSTGGTSRTKALLQQKHDQAELRTRKINMVRSIQETGVKV